MSLRERYQEIMEILGKEIDEEIRYAKEMDKTIETLPIQQQRILEMRYKQGKKFRQIAKETSYSERQVQRIEKKAVLRLKSLISIKMS